MISVFLLGLRYYTSIYSISYLLYVLYLLPCEYPSFLALDHSNLPTMNSRVALRRLGARLSHNQATGTVVADPRRPYLFYHLVQPPTPLAPASDLFALSFLSQPPPNAEASAIIGWIPAPNGASSLSPEQLAQRLSWREFRENGECIL
jgi:hypothetical protein